MPGSSCCAGSPGIRARESGCRHGVERLGAAAHPGAARTSGTRRCSRSTSRRWQRPRRRVPGAAGVRSSAELAPALAERGPAGLRSVGRVPAARPGAPAAVVSAFARPSTCRVAYGLTERHRGRAARRAADRVRRAAIRRRRCSRSSRWSRPGCSSPGIIIDAKSGVSGAGKTPTERTHFSEMPRQHRRPTACSAIGTAPRSSRSSACRSRSCRTWCRSIAASSRRSTRGCSRASTRRRSRARSRRAYADAPFVRLTGADLPEIKHVAHTNFCDIGWRVDRAGRPARDGRRASTTW